MTKRTLSYFILVLLTLSASGICAQQPEIREAVTFKFSDTPQGRKSAMGSRQIGVQSLFGGVYRDSIVRYFDRIEAYRPQTSDTLVYRYYQAIFGQDTLCFKERRETIVRPYAGKHLLEVESLRVPYQRFEVEIDRQDADEIAALTQTMQQMKTSDILLNNSQTCIFYALNLLLDAEGVDPSPVITRNTTFVNGHQLNAFFDHILTAKCTYPCRYKVLQKADLPDRCVLVFRNARQEYIHALFYRKDTGAFYSKNGLFPPVIVHDIRPLTTRYGRYDMPKSDLSPEGLDRLADSVVIYTLY